MPLSKFFLEENIPAFGDQKAHYHLDILYQVVIPEQKVRLKQDESSNIGWFTLKEAIKLRLYKNTLLMIKQMLS